MDLVSMDLHRMGRLETDPKAQKDPSSRRVLQVCLVAIDLDMVHMVHTAHIRQDQRIHRPVFLLGLEVLDYPSILLNPPSNRRHRCRIDDRPQVQTSLVCLEESLSKYSILVVSLQ
jgi:hypothetical protein